VLAARTLFAGEQSVNREFFDTASQHSGEIALNDWRCCLEAGDSMAHFALGYTFYELGRYHEAYRHLRYYAQIAPASAWNWCWLGKAAQAIGETGEARAAYERAWSQTNKPNRLSARRTASARAFSLKPPLEYR